MSTTCNHDDLLELARGDLPPSRAAEIESHAAECAECASELRWLRTERALFRKQDAAPSAGVWARIEERVAGDLERRRARRQRFLQIGSGATVVAAAAGLLLTLWVQGTTKTAPSSSTPRLEQREPEKEKDLAQALSALDDAELKYRGAIRDLEAAYEKERDRLDPDEVERFESELGRLRKVLNEEQAAAQDDVWARRRLLRTYSVYMRTMQAMVLEGRK
jgi:hypothetical protein